MLGCILLLNEISRMAHIAATVPDMAKTAPGEIFSQIIPAVMLANRVATLDRAVKKPMAVAESSLRQRLVIHG